MIFAYFLLKDKIEHQTMSYQVISSSVLEPSSMQSDGYYVAYKPITLSCILFMFIEMKFIHCHSCVMFVMKSMSMRND